MYYPLQKISNKKLIEYRQKKSPTTGRFFTLRIEDLSKLVPGYDKDFDYDTSYGIFDALEIMDFYDEDLYYGFFQRYGLGGNK